MFIFNSILKKIIQKGEVNLKDPKIYRLVLGLIILFSIFLFQGSEDHHGCTQCEENYVNSSEISITNLGDDVISVFLFPLDTQNVISPWKTTTIRVNEGLYHLVAMWGTLKIIDSRVISVTKGSKVSVTIEWRRNQ